MRETNVLQLADKKTNKRKSIRRTRVGGGNIDQLDITISWKFKYRIAFVMALSKSHLSPSSVVTRPTTIELNNTPDYALAVPIFLAARRLSIMRISIEPAEKSRRSSTNQYIHSSFALQDYYQSSRSERTQYPFQLQRGANCRLSG